MLTQDFYSRVKLKFTGLNASFSCINLLDSMQTARLNYSLLNLFYHDRRWTVDIFMGVRKTRVGVRVGVGAGVYLLFFFSKYAALELRLGLGLALVSTLTLKQHSFEKKIDPTPSPRFTDTLFYMSTVHLSEII